ncbi:Bcr/CflA family efflux MFS transporter [Paracoccus sp. S-4012]|uniref:Bcr/CflA family efflux MFS transporter n=1 Tax=Paracoccus sp. S-4012 TaxID=2665648 RepID=UPI00351B718A
MRGLTPGRLAQPEFVAMLAFVFATVAFSIDSMLPALPQIAAELVPEDVNRAQLVLTSFMVGLGVGTLGAGPLSDAFGRKAVIAAGFLIYIAGAMLAIVAPTMETMLLARAIQGFGAAAPRIVSQALVRDLYEGREMARILSFVNMLFILVPAAAPAMGMAIIAVTGWRGVFGAFVVFGLVALLWVALRQAETLPAAARRPMRAGPLLADAREAIGDRVVIICTLTVALGFAQMFALLSSAQQLFVETYGVPPTAFPIWFAVMALLSGSGAIVNARMVRRVGMRRMASAAYAAQIVIAAAVLLLMASAQVPEALRFPLFFAWALSLFLMAGITFGNLNALALQNMGHIAGTTSSVVSAISTLLAMAIAAPVGLLYDGTALPVVTAALICSTLAWLLLRRLGRPAA